MNVLVTGHLPEEIVALLRKEHDVEANEEDRPMQRERLLHRIGDKQGLLSMVTDNIDQELLERAPNLKMIANFGVGYDNLDLQAATAKGIPVSNTPGVLTEATADITFTLILATARRVVEGDRRNRAGEFKFWAPLNFLGRDVSGKTLGIIGLGRIGKAVARRAKGFDLRVIYHNRHRIEASEEKELRVEYVSLKTVISEADFISLHVPFTDQTRHLIGHEELGWMKPTAYLINTSRGPVVNEPALTPGLTDLDNATLLPHVGSATLGTRTKMARLAAENLLAGLRGDIPPNCLNCDLISGTR